MQFLCAPLSQKSILKSKVKRQEKKIWNEMDIKLQVKFLGAGITNFLHIFNLLMKCVQWLVDDYDIFTYISNVTGILTALHFDVWKNAMQIKSHIIKRYIQIGWVFNQLFSTCSKRTNELISSVVLICLFHPENLNLFTSIPRKVNDYVKRSNIFNLISEWIWVCVLEFMRFQVNEICDTPNPDMQMGFAHV